MFEYLDWGKEKELSILTAPNLTINLFTNRLNKQRQTYKNSITFNALLKKINQLFILR